jgi:hypothetical protein
MILSWKRLLEVLRWRRRNVNRSCHSHPFLNQISFLEKVMHKCAQKLYFYLEMLHTIVYMVCMFNLKNRMQFPFLPCSCTFLGMRATTVLTRKEFPIFTKSIAHNFHFWIYRTCLQAMRATNHIVPP